MSLSNSITKLLNIEDPNLKFNENFLEERIIKGKRCLVIKGYLSNSFMYKCKNCNKKFISKTEIVDFCFRISNNVKRAVYNCAKEIMSKSLIARLYNVCDNTVQRIFDTMFCGDTVYKSSIPEAICIDEFTFKKKTFAFNICDAKTEKNCRFN